MSNLPNPLLKPNYSNLVNSSDLVAKNLVNNFTNIYTNYVTFSSISSKVDTVGLDNAATQIQNSINDIINILTPCAKDQSEQNIKCKLPSCTWSNLTERLIIDFTILLTSMTSASNTKSEYNFLAFNAFNSLSELVTSNPTNKGLYSDINNPIYMLCSDTKYYPISPDPKLQAQYKALKSRMSVQQLNKDTRQNDFMITQFLSYILLPTVIFIILILIYLKFSKNPQVGVPASPVSTEQILTGVTTTEPTPPVKTGGAFYDTLNFLSTLSVKLFRI